MKTETYSQLRCDFLALLQGGPRLPWETAFCSLIALLKERFPAISWVGLYREHRAGSGELFVGPYQGKPACTFIPRGKGVCGAAFLEDRVLIVPDVNAFPGHIACDAQSRSEIVLPLRDRQGRRIGVLDLDSHALGAFDESDQAGIEALLKILTAETATF